MTCYRPGASLKQRPVVVRDIRGLHKEVALEPDPEGWMGLGWKEGERYKEITMDKAAGGGRRYS